MNVIVPNTGVQTLVGNIQTAFNSLLYVRLYQNDYLPTSSTLIGDFVECDFAGYPGKVKTIGWTVPLFDGEGYTTSCQVITFQHSRGPLGNWVYGYYGTLGDSTLVTCERFAKGPFQMNTYLQSIIFRPRFRGRSIYRT